MNVVGRDYDGVRQVWVLGVVALLRKCPARRWVAAVWGRGVGPGNLLYFPSGLKLMMLYPGCASPAVTAITHARDE